MDYIAMLGNQARGQADMRAFTISLVSSICAVVALSWSETSRAQAVPLIFQTTFNCPDWSQSMGLEDHDVCANGDGIEGYGGWTANGQADQITAAANNPVGPGGKGFRHYRATGGNINGGGLTMTLPTSAKEVWVRFYMRYSSGFSWNNGNPTYTKEHYWGAGEDPYIIFGIQGANSWGVHFSGTSTNYPSSLKWSTSQGGSTGDGKWHVYEYHLKQNGSGGLIEIWVDGVKVLTQTANIGSSALRWFVLGSNQSTVTGCNPCYTDYDDIAISTSGYIGPINASQVRLSPPQNLRIQ